MSARACESSEVPPRVGVLVLADSRRCIMRRSAAVMQQRCVHVLIFCLCFQVRNRFWIMGKKSSRILRH